MAPVAIAEQVKEAMTEHEAILDVNAVNGYLNIRANPVWLAGRLLGGDVRHMASGSRREVLIEHTSANPNGRSMWASPKRHPWRHPRALAPIVGRQRHGGVLRR